MEVQTDCPTGAELLASWCAAASRLDAASSDAERSQLATEAAHRLNAYLVRPAASVAELAEKLELFRAEELWDGWGEAEAIVDTLAADAGRLSRCEGLAPFAVEWLARWRAAGGWGTVGPEGGLSLGFPEAPHPAPGSALPAVLSQSQAAYEAGVHDGRRRELLDLLGAVPGARQAVAQLVAAESEAPALAVAAG